MNALNKLRSLLAAIIFISVDLIFDTQLVRTLSEDPLLPPVPLLPPIPLLPTVLLDITFGNNALDISLVTTDVD